MPSGLPWVAGAFLVKVVGDLAYAGQQITGTYVTGSWIGPLRPLAFALVGAAAVWQLTQPRSETADDEANGSDLKDEVRVAVPYAAMPVACFMILISQMNAGEPAYLYTAGPLTAGLALVGLVLGRQAITLVENRRLHASLTVLSRDLEDRVDQRTRELSVLNRVAVTMSHCGSSKQVVEKGLRLTQEALGHEAVGLWLRPSGSRQRFFGGPGLSRPARIQLTSAAGQVFDSAAGQESANPVHDPVVLRAKGGNGAEAIPAEPFAEVAVVPLVSRQTSLGALCLAPWDESGQAGKPQLELASAVAAQVAVAFENVRRFEDAHYLAQRDPTTSLLNHRGMNERLDEEFSRCRRSGADFSVVMMDMDNFKLFNDTYGHAVGDEVLQMVARVLVKAVRKYDVVGRYGGDEFLALLPDTDADGAVVLVRRVQAAVKEGAYFLEKQSQNRVPIALSYGIATYPSEGGRLAEVMAVADANLYRSKQKGGNEITAPSVEHKPGEKMGVFSVLEGLVTTVDNKDHYTRRHSDDVCDRSVALACKMGLSPDTQRILRIAGILHDVGKIGVPDSVLRKPGSLTDEEFEAIKQHVILGKLIIKEIPHLEEVLDAVATHHERFDGVGYPEGLKGEDIPLLGRILAVTDAYSAMTTDRPYRRAFTTSEAVTELKRVSGKQLDPGLVEVFIEVVEEEDNRLSTVGATIA
jgi:diguanylate cyclase (GGDEF)-like protein